MSSYVPLDPSFKNVVKFVDGLFDPKVRDVDKVIASIKENKLFHSFADPASRGLVLRSWMNAWKKAEGDPYEQSIPQQPTDAALIAFLAKYIRENKLSLFVPPMYRAGWSVNKRQPKPFYRSPIWDASEFRNGGKWSYGAFDSDGEIVENGTVAQYLLMLYYGAHVVVVHSDKDGASGVANFRTELDKAFPSGKMLDPHHSHYGSNFYTSAYYLDMDSDHERADGPLIAAFLTGYTANNDPNSFTQLEGWVSAIRGGGEWGGARHIADYDAHKATLWNFSTFGACAYSEKRSSPVFLANSSFVPSVSPVTHMPLYTGAGSFQGWMNPGYNSEGLLQGVVYDQTTSDNLTYFFHGQKYLRLNIRLGAPNDEHHPKPITDKFKGLEDWDDFTAVVCNPKAGKKGVYYFFRGDEYLEWNVDSWSRAKTAHRTADGFPGLATAGFTTFNAVVYDPYRGVSGKFYFFRGEELLSFDLHSNKADWSAPRKVTDYFPDLKATGLTKILTAGGSWVSRELGAGAAPYITWMMWFFNDNEFIAWDAASWTVRGGDDPRPMYDPRSFSGLWWY